MIVPNVILKEKIGPDWHDVETKEYFQKSRVVVFSLPGAYTPVCSNEQLPDYEKNYDSFTNLGIDEVYLCTVNDFYVTEAWLKSLRIEKVKFIADGSGEFTRGMNMLVWKPNQNFGYRSWRYSMIVDNMKVEKMFIEDNLNNIGNDTDPYEASKPEYLLNYLQSN